MIKQIMLVWLPILFLLNEHCIRFSYKKHYDDYDLNVLYVPYILLINIILHAPNSYSKITQQMEICHTVKVLLRFATNNAHKTNDYHCTSVFQSVKLPECEGRGKKIIVIASK